MLIRGGGALIREGRLVQNGSEGGLLHGGRLLCVLLPEARAHI